MPSRRVSRLPIGGCLRALGKEEGAKKALEWINNLTREVKVGEIFEGIVVKIMDFGAFVELFPNQDGLVHTFTCIFNNTNSIASECVKLAQILCEKQCP